MAEPLHEKSKVHIYVTKDYTRFKNLLGNRLVDDAKIKRIIKDIEEGNDMLPYCPVIVDKNMRVVDGQHRLWVARKLKISAYYVIKPDEVPIQNVAKMNSNTSRWKTADFIHCYKSKGKTDYAFLEAFQIKYGFPMGVCVNLLLIGSVSTGGVKTDSKIAFERGEFQIKFEDKAKEVADLAIRFKKSSAYKNRNFIYALEKLIQKNVVDFDKLLLKFNDNAEQIDGCSSHKEFLQSLENIYNIKNSKRVPIY